MRRRGAGPPRAKRNPAERRKRVRMRLVLWGLLTLCTLVGVRLFQLQLSPDDRLVKYDSERKIGWTRLPLPRGSIYAQRDKPLATNRRAASLSANPSKIEHPAELAQLLSERLGMDYDLVFARLTRCDKDGEKLKGVPIKRRLTEEERHRLGTVDALSPDGLWLDFESVRSYPEGQLAAQVIGYVNNESCGWGGIELALDKYLRSTPGEVRARRDGKRMLLPSSTVSYIPPHGGDSAYLTLDTAIQHTLERELDRALAFTQAEGAMGIVMDPHTGAILALACRPAFDPNKYDEFPAPHRENRAALDAFEPGSAFKIVTMAAAIELGKVTPDTLIDCEGGTYNPYGHTIRDVHPLDLAPVTECFEESSNIAIVKIAALLGPEVLDGWVKRFGFAQKTCPDFHAESRGIYHAREDWSRLMMGSLPMGQGISVTILQLARAYSVIANGGHLVEPHVVERIVQRDGQVRYAWTEKPSQPVLSPSAAETMKQLCCGVVLNGTGRHARIREYRAGAKTGTAQIAKPNGGGYYEDKYMAVLAGFAPLDNPAVCAVIVVNDPKGDLHYGGCVCGPIFKNVVRETLSTMNCPQEPLPEDVEEVRDYVYGGEDADTVVARLDSVKLIEISEEELLVAPEEVELPAPKRDSSPEVPKLPSLIGMTKRQAKERLASLDLQWDTQGSGWVVAQRPPAGTPLAQVTACQLVFSAGRHEVSDDFERTAATPET